jgi:hydrogenase expression/formation protein HypC
MCLAVPMQIASIEESMGMVEVSGTQQRVSLAFIDTPQIGEYVLVHAGFAIQKIDEEQAKATIAELNRLGEIMKTAQK